MAIISHLPGLKVTIEVNGKTAKEYDAPEDAAAAPEDMSFHVPEPTEDADPYVVKYIESVPGARFRVRVVRTTEFRKRSAGLVHGLELDGQKAPHTHLDLWNSADGRPQRDCEYKHCDDSWSVGSNDEGWTKKWFRFGSLDTDDGDASRSVVEEQLARAKNLGVVRIYFRYVESVGDSHPAPAARLVENDDKLHEKSLKGRAVDCAVSFEAGQLERRVETRCSVRWTDNTKRPFAVFEFRYRSMDGLIKEGIVPRPDIEERVDNMSEDEVRRLAREMLGLRENHGPLSVKSENARGIKREFLDLEADSGLSDEAFFTRYKGRKLDNGKIQVDLTDD